MITTRSILMLLAAQVAFLAAAPSARASIITFGLDATTNGETPNKVDSSKPFLTFTFEDTATDQVTMTFDATNLQLDNFISGVLFNIDTTLDLIVLDLPDGWSFYGASTPPAFDSDSVGDSANAGLFSILISFNTDPSQGDLFSGGETRTAVFGRIDLRATDFLVTSIDKPVPDPSAGGWYASAGVRGIQLPGGRVGSGFGGADTFSVVPEPSSFAVAAGIGGLALAGMALRRRREQGHSDRRSS